MAVPVGGCLTSSYNVLVKHRRHALTIDSGWREVADKALAFFQKHANAEPATGVRSSSRRGSRDGRSGAARRRRER
jgi:hypothetical protein